MPNDLRILSGNALKILAAIFMVIDHVGLMFFSDLIIFRIIGRLAFPIFAFMISEGAKYTKNKLRYFLLMFSLAAVCQIVYYFFDDGSLYMCILVTFSLSILLIYALQWAKKCLLSDSSKTWEKIVAPLSFILLSTAIYFLNGVVEIDYGFAGILVPVFASLFDFRGTDAPEVLKKLDTVPLRVLCLGVGLLILALESIEIQFYSLLACLFLLLYSGERGKYKMKYFFYLFYPLHLVVLEGIYLLIYYF